MLIIFKFQLKESEFISFLRDKQHDISFSSIIIYIYIYIYFFLNNEKALSLLVI